jgi:DNA-binding protein H-NS
MDATVERIQKMVSSLSYTELDELIELIQRERAGKLDEARHRLMTEFEEKAASIGLTPNQIFGQLPGAQERPKRGKKTEQQSAPAAVKFRSPSGQTWSGRGRKPIWLTQAEAGGQSAEEFRVHE